jgi:hypothetical protein
MGNYRHWGPHGQEGSPLELTPNPTPPGHFQNIGAGQPEDFPPVASGGGSGVFGPLTHIVLSLMMVPFVWLFWVCLYPLTAIAGVGAALLTTPLFIRLMLPDDRQAALGFGMIAGFVVFVLVSRVECRLARNRVFRGGRHVLRLALLGVFVAPWFMGFVHDAEAQRASLDYMQALLLEPRFLLQHLAVPSNLAITIGVAAGMHFLLTRAERLRDFWHRRLRWIGLK